MRFLKRVVVIGGLIAAAHGTRAAAQSVAPRAEPTPGTAADSTVIWDHVLVHVYEMLSHQLRTAALDSTPVAWQMSLPATGLPWARVEAHLRMALRARAATAADTAVWKLEIRPMSIRNDTAWIDVITDRELRCAGSDRPGGWGNVHHVIVPFFRSPHDRGRWGVARTTTVMHGDRIGCRSRKR